MGRVREPDGRVAAFKTGLEATLTDIKGTEETTEIGTVRTAFGGAYVVATIDVYIDGTVINRVWKRAASLDRLHSKNKRRHLANQVRHRHSAAFRHSGLRYNAWRRCLYRKRPFLQKPWVPLFGVTKVIGKNL